MMNYTIARAIADEPQSFKPSALSAAFGWADRKCRDHRLTKEYRLKCLEIAKAIWAHAGQKKVEVGFAPGEAEAIVRAVEPAIKEAAKIVWARLQAQRAVRDPG